ncbi:MAG TPA: hypothetical protein VJA94_04035 [Candidatus Angelobacter sp.]
MKKLKVATKAALGSGLNQSRLPPIAANRKIQPAWNHYYRPEIIRMLSYFVAGMMQFHNGKLIIG